jgi:hypothetical protein
MAQEMANLQALMSQGQGKPPTVIEQAMMTNAQAETPQAPQGIAQAPQPALAGTVQTPEMSAVGVGALPTGQSFQPQNFAGGGIVAFAGEGRSDINLFDIVDQQQRQDPSLAGMFNQETRDESQGFRRQYASLADAIAAARQARSPLRQQSAEEIAFQEYLNKSKERTGQQTTESGWLRALEAGLGIMGGTSPYALTNIGKGAEAAVKGFGEDVKERRKGTLAEMASAAQQARQKRLEGLEDIAAGERMFEKDLEAEYRQAVLNKDTDWMRRYNGYLPKVMKDLKINDPNDPEVKARTTRMVDESIALQAERLSQRRFEEEGDRASSALTNSRSELSKDTQYKILSAKAISKDPKAIAEANEYALKILNKNRQALGLPSVSNLPTGLATEPSAAAKPEARGGSNRPDINKIQGVPSGSKIGSLTNMGWEVFDSKGTLIGHIKE